MTKHPKLELTWIGKDNRPRLEPRVLLEAPEKSYHAKQRVSELHVLLCGVRADTRTATRDSNETD